MSKDLITCLFVDCTIYVIHSVASVLQFVTAKRSSHRLYYVFSKHFHPCAFVRYFQLAALWALFVEHRVISVDMKSFYLLLFCYDTAVGSGWRGAYCVHGLYKTRSQMYLWDFLQVNVWVFPPVYSSFCPVITSTNCIDWVHEICDFSVKSKAQNSKSNACFREEMSFSFFGTSIGSKCFFRESRLDVDKVVLVLM